MTTKPTPASQPDKRTSLSADEIGKAINSVHFPPSTAPTDMDKRMESLAQANEQVEAARTHREERRQRLEQPSPARSDKDAERDISDPAVKLEMAIAWINSSAHGENCFLHDDGGEYDRCFCGKDSILQYLEGGMDEAERAPSGELTDKELADPEYMRAYVAELQEELAAALARRATAGTTAAPSAVLEEQAATIVKQRLKIQALEKRLAERATAGNAAPIYQVRDKHIGAWCDVRAQDYELVPSDKRRVLYAGDAAHDFNAEGICRHCCAYSHKAHLPCTAGNTAPTEAEAVEGGASALRAEPAGDLDALVREYGNVPLFGPGRTRRIVMREIYRAAGEIFAACDAESDPRCRAEGGITCNNSSPELASNTATTAPGDLPPEPKHHYLWKGLTLVTIEAMREYGRACIASNAGAAPLDTDQAT